MAVRLDEAAREADLPEWSERELGLSISAKTARDAVRPLRPPSARTGRPPREEHARPDRTPAVWDWLRVDAPALDLVELFFELPNPSWVPRPDLVPALSRLEGIVEVIETGAGGDVFAVGLVRNEREADHLEARVQEHLGGQGVRMRRIARRTQESERATWRELARREVAE